MIHSKNLVLVLTSLLLTSCATFRKSTAPAPADQSPKQPIEYAMVAQGETVVTKTGYALVYDSNHKQAKWVAYSITRDEALVKGEERTENFQFDELVPGGSPKPTDYARSGYDRGHLAAAGDMKWSAKAMDDSFLMSNMTPQRPQLNRVFWKNLETKVRGWGARYGEVYVTTGPVLKDGLPRLKNKISIPERFFKVVFEKTSTPPRAIAFIIPQDFKGKDHCVYATTVDQAEAETGIDFFPALEDQIESAVESSSDCAGWK